MNMILFCLLVLTLGVCGGCDKPAGAPAEVVDPTEPKAAHPKLQTMKIFVGPEEMQAELALTPEQLRTGMMFRTNKLADNEGMLFPLPYTQQASFWMKNCPLPLSAAYIDPDGVIREIHDFQPFNTNSVVSDRANIRFVLETDQGWFQRHKIEKGMTVTTERGSLLQTFFPTR